jgi:hypothetical protein
VLRILISVVLATVVDVNARQSVIRRGEDLCAGVPGSTVAMLMDASSPDDPERSLSVLHGVIVAISISA